jgi:Lar family restriction alleviation protein
MNDTLNPSMAEIQAHPCPFCGSDEYLRVEAIKHQDLQTGKGGVIRRNAKLEDAVKCHICGAMGPESYVEAERGKPLTADLRRQSEQAAILAWNARAPINTKAFELVETIINKSLAALKDS